jgi:hypothetical protein
MAVNTNRKIKIIPTRNIILLPTCKTSRKKQFVSPNLSNAGVWTGNSSAANAPYTRFRLTSFLKHKKRFGLVLHRFAVTKRFCCHASVGNCNLWQPSAGRQRDRRSRGPAHRKLKIRTHKKTDILIAHFSSTI